MVEISNKKHSAIYLPAERGKNWWILYKLCQKRTFSFWRRRGLYLLQEGRIFIKLGFKPLLFNPFDHGRFLDPYFKVLSEGVKLIFLNLLFIGASAIKSFVTSRIFRYGLPKDILNKGQKKWVKASKYVLFDKDYFLNINFKE